MMKCKYCKKKNCCPILLPCPYCKEDNEYCSYGDNIKKVFGNVNEESSCWKCKKKFKVKKGRVSKQ